MIEDAPELSAELVVDGAVPSQPAVSPDGCWVGGSIGFADPAGHVGFGYTMNQMRTGMPVDPRALRLIDALYASL